MTLARRLNDRTHRTISRRSALQALGLAAVGAPLSLSAQGRCMLTFGTPACNTADIAPIFAPTGWKTVALDHITFRARRLPKGGGVLHRAHGMDAAQRRRQAGGAGHGRVGIGDLQAAPAGIVRRSRGGRRRPRGRGAAARPVRVVVESFAFAIDRRGTRRRSKAELTNARPDAGRRARRQGLRELPREGSRRLGSADLQRQRPGEEPQDRRRHARSCRSRRRSRRPAGRPCGSITSPSTPRTTRRARRSTRNLLGWAPTYDEGSQNELLMGDVGDIIVRGGNPLDPAIRQGRRRGGPADQIDHISLRDRALGYRRREDGAREARPARADRHLQPPSAARTAPGCLTKSIPRRSRAITRRRPTASTCRSAMSPTTTGWRCPMPSNPSRRPAG